LQGCALHLRNGNSWISVGWRGGSDGRGRREPVHGGLVAASMPLTPLPSGPPRLRQISAICWGRIPLLRNGL